MTGTFGEDRGDHFHLGIDIGGGEQTVRPVLPGELVFRYEENADYTSLPRGVGSFAVIRHQDDVLSVYCHLQRDPARPVRTTFAARDAGRSSSAIPAIPRESTCTSASTTARPGRGSIRCRCSRSWSTVNHPWCGGSPCAGATGSTDLVPGVIVPSGPAEVLVETYDVRDDVRFLWPLAPYAVRLALNGAEVTRLTFEALEVREGRMVLLGTTLTAPDVYATDRLLRLGTVELRGGESHLLAVVRDFAGNEAAREVFFTVRD